MPLPRNAFGNLLARYRAVLRRCRWKNTLAALLLTGMVALPVENLWANSGGKTIDVHGIGIEKWYVGINGTASNNNVIIDTTGTFAEAAGGYSGSDLPQGNSAANNTLIIKGNVDHVKNAYGGYIFLDNVDSSVTHNKTFIIESGKVISNANGGYVSTKGTGSATANYNSLTISSSTNDFSVEKSAFGGYAYADQRNATANNNTLTIEGAGKVQGQGSGGFAYAQNGKATANYNTLTIEGAGKVESLVRGGEAWTGDFEATATGNTVFLNGGSVGDGSRVSGGYVFVNNGSGTVKDNTVVLGASLGANALASVELYGGDFYKQGSGTVTVSNNTLEVWGHGLTARAINNFENLYFILPASIRAGGTVLTITGGAPTTFGTKANVGVAVAAGARPLNVGDKVTLLKNDKGLQNAAGDPLAQGTDYQKVSLNGKTLKGGQGISLEYDFTLSNTDTTLDATVTDFTPTPTPTPAPTPTGQPAGRVREETKAVLESRAAVTAALNAGADLVAGSAMRNALAGFARAQEQDGMAFGDVTGKGAHLIPFAAVSGGWQRVETGSHVNIGGIAAVAGLAGKLALSHADLLAGAFFEYGTSRLDTHNSFASGDVDGKGHASYTGGGILARIDVTGSLLRGLYAEGSFRFGGMQSDWHTDDLRDAVTGRRASYDLYSPYVGAHAGLGYVWQATDTLALDIYGKYFWTRLYGDDAHVALDRFDFDDMDSQRLRLGARVDWKFAESASLYAGAAWEHEFNGRSRATTYGMEAPAPTMKGDTGVFDLGFSLSPAAMPDLTLEAGLTGYAGTRQGISGNLTLKYEF